MDAQFITPNVKDRETHVFFEAAAEGRLVFRACNRCHRGIHPPSEHCGFCGSWETAWRNAVGTGTLYAWTTVIHQTHARYPTPYTTIVVTLDDNSDVRLVGYLEGQPELKMGMPMQVWFQEIAPGVVLPQWRPTGPSSEPAA